MPDDNEKPKPLSDAEIKTLRAICNNKRWRAETWDKIKQYQGMLIGAGGILVFGGQAKAYVGTLLNWFMP